MAIDTETTDRIAVQTRILLLVEDNPADAELVQEMLDAGQAGPAHSKYEVFVAPRLSSARAMLESRHVDVVLLDLRLPDATGVEGVRSILEVANEMPVVVLTGLEEEEIGLQCINAGAQDYLTKSELQPATLRRTIGYAISRLREIQVRELQGMLENYRSLTSQGANTSVTASLAGMGRIAERDGVATADLTKDYCELLTDYVDALVYKRDAPKIGMDMVATRLGDLGGGPRDLIDIHVVALEYAVQGATVERARALVIESRLLALEMMGKLVDYYRIGLRRRAGGLKN